jgi:hypothetical protein
MRFSCDTCQRPVSADEAFFRSVNLRPVAWCRECWFAKQGIPAQRTAAEDETTAPRRRRRLVLIRR